MVAGFEFFGEMFAIDCFGKNAGTGGFTHTARTAEKICVSQFFAFNRIFQGGSERILPATVSFVDIAGIVRGASEGEGLGNKFLANIREADAIAQVVRTALAVKY